MQVSFLPRVFSPYSFSLSFFLFSLSLSLSLSLMRQRERERTAERTSFCRQRKKKENSQRRHKDMFCMLGGQKTLPEGSGNNSHFFFFFFFTTYTHTHTWSHVEKREIFLFILFFLNSATITDIHTTAFGRSKVSFRLVTPRLQGEREKERKKERKKKRKVIYWHFSRGGEAKARERE